MANDHRSGSTRTDACPSPDDCPFTTGSASELAEHVNSEHAGEFQRESWSDTDAGRAARPKVEADVDEIEEPDHDERDNPRL